MRENIDVSVVIPAYNAGPFLAQAVASVLAERRGGIDVVVADDGSTDGSLKALEDLPVRVLAGEHRGEAAARNAGVRAARGRIIGFLDADDLLTAGSLAARTAFLSEHPHEQAVGGLPASLIDEDSKVVADVFERMAARLSFPMRLSEAFYRAGNFFPVSCSLYLYRREVFDLVGGYDESLPIAPDCDFHFRMLRAAEIPVMKIPTFARRLHGANLSLAGGARAWAFRPEVVAAVRAINRRYGYEPAEISPWESDYL